MGNKLLTQVIYPGGRQIEVRAPFQEWLNYAVNSVKCHEVLLEALIELENAFSCKPYHRDEQKILHKARFDIAMSDRNNCEDGQ